MTSTDPLPDEPNTTSMLSPAEVARALGVSTTTVKRWIDEGLLPAERTEGGHRRVAPKDVLTLVGRCDLPRVDLARIRQLAQSPSATRSPAGQLKSALIRGASGEAWGLLQATYHDKGMVALADELVAPAMHGVGLDWQTGTINVMREHRATELCSELLYQLAGRVTPLVSATASVAVGCSPTSDVYTVASLLAQLCLSEAGFKAAHLGAGVSAQDLHQHAVEQRASVVWISVTDIASKESFTQEFAPIVKQLRKRKMSVFVGGQQMSEELAHHIGASGRGSNMHDLVKLADRHKPESSK